MAEKNKLSAKIKSEILEQISPNPATASVIDLSSSSDSDSDNSSDDDVVGDNNSRPKKKKKVEDSMANVKLPLGFLDPLPSKETRLSSSPAPATPTPLAIQVPENLTLALPPTMGNGVVSTENNSKQFWKAGDYEGASSGDWDSSLG